MLIQKLQLSKIPDSLEVALEYLGAERWVCWYWDEDGNLLIEDINSSYFGNSQAWLLFCSYVDNNVKVNKSKDYDYFQSLITGQYSDDEVHEAETQVTENLSLFNEQEAYLFDTQTRELYSGSAMEIQTLIKQPNSLAMWAELQGQTSNQTKIESELSEPLPTIDEWAVTKALIKLVVVWFGVAVILPVPWVSAMHLIKYVADSHFPVNQSTNSLDKLKADLALENQTAESFGKKETLKGSKTQKSECKTHVD